MAKVEILPMMYLALSYDHRLIDGRESVGFLVTIKKLPQRSTSAIRRLVSLKRLDSLQSFDAKKFQSWLLNVWPSIEL
ncbi:2-oxo acid dehydrogenase subunit E2 [Vibrio lentus]|nr:2-oxo acid dehydrogenase subunit E2 [Vibrio lentus]